MTFIDRIIDRAKKNKKTVVLPETMDDRVLKAAEVIVNEGIANVILIGNKEEILKNNSNLDKCKIIDPNEDISFTNDLISKLVEIRKNKGLTEEEARRLLTEDYMYYACMLVKVGMADGVVSGACHSTANTLRPALQIIKTKEDCKLVSAFFLMVVPDCQYGSNGTFIFADSGLWLLCYLILVWVVLNMN